MGILSSIVGGGVEGTINSVGKVLDSLTTNDEERATAERLMAELRQKPYLAQIHLNTKEAGHRSVFVAGWRPFIGWTCGVALGYAYVLQPMFVFGLVAGGADASVIAAVPEVGISEMMPVLMGLLGLGAMRSVDKYNNSTSR